MNQPNIPEKAPVGLVRDLRRGRAAALGAYTIVRTQVLGQPVLFAVRNPEDVIQQHHMRGRFYEEPELEIIRAAFRPGGTFLDIGANVGNHALFVAMFLHPRQVIAVEPNPMAYDNLLANVLMNRVEHLLDFAWLGHGVAAEEAEGYGIVVPKGNLGAGHLVRGADEGAIPVTTGDRIVGDRKIDFIKMDVEGMEMQALAGLAGVVARDRPKMFIEVDDRNRAAFLEWVDANGYRIEDQLRRYKTNENFLLCPQVDPKKPEDQNA